MVGSSLAAMSVGILTGSQGFGALTPSLYQPNAGEIISTIAVEGFHSSTLEDYSRW